MDSRAVIVASCWIAISIIASVYMCTFGPDVDIAFGVLLPVGFLVLIAIIVTFVALQEPKSRKIPID
jgi:hypothetical protein